MIASKAVGKPVKIGKLSRLQQAFSTDLVGSEKPYANLHASSLTIRDLVEPPVEVYVQQIYQLCSTLWIHVVHPKDHLPS